MNTIHHVFHTFTPGWRPESNRASFLMMFPTPGMTAWSMRTSQSLLLLWLLTAFSAWEKLNLEEHTSRLSIGPHPLLAVLRQPASTQFHSAAGTRRIYGCCYCKRATGSRVHYGGYTFSKMVSLWYTLPQFVCYETEQRRWNFQTVELNVCLATTGSAGVDEEDKCWAEPAAFVMQQPPVFRHSLM